MNCCYHTQKDRDVYEDWPDGEGEQEQEQEGREEGVVNPMEEPLDSAKEGEEDKTTVASLIASPSEIGDIV